MGGLAGLGGWAGRPGLMLFVGLMGTVSDYVTTYRGEMLI
jgi:hypothetical protein